MFLLLLSLLFVPPSRADAVDAYSRAFFLAEARLHDFDAELAAHPKKGFLRRAKPYRDLLALRILLEQRARDFLASAKNARALRGRLEALPVADRLALSGLLHHRELAGLGLPVFYATLAQELAARRAARLLLLERESAARRDAPLLAEVHAISSGIDFGKSRASPPAIRPGSGPEGTVSGDSFPARTWALTFDDGPNATLTPQALAHLEAFGKKATFFWLAECLVENTAIPPKAIALGHSVNNHSWSHPNLTKATAAELQKEVVQSTVKDTELYGGRPRFFRLPFGSGVGNQPLRQLLADQGFVHVLWNVDSLDWQDKDPASILARVQKEMSVEKQGIILFHDIHPQSIEGSRKVLEWSATLDGTPGALRWVTLPEIVDELNAAAPLSTLNPPKKQARPLALYRRAKQR